MKQIQSFVAVLCVYLVSAPSTYGQQSEPQQTGPRQDTTPRLDSENPHWYSRFTHPYESRMVAPVNISNSGRIDSLLRSGNLYLSLQDAIALALENNIDIEVQRYQFPLAEADLLRAKAGAAISGLNTSTNASGLSNGLTAVSSTAGGNGNIVSTGGGLQTGTASGPNLSFDPAITGTVSYGHTTQPSTNSILSGLTSSISDAKTVNFGVTQGFLSGGTATLSYNNNIATSNAFNNNYNPATTSNLDLTITQPLLQGFGFAVNNRAIRVAKNNLQVADLVFKQQVINTVASVVQNYWILVSFNADVDVKMKSLALSQRLLDENKKQVDVGTLAPITIVQAEAEVASREQDLLTSQTNVLQQETVLKNQLSRNGLSSPSIAEAHIIVTDPIRIPPIEKTEPIQDMWARALDSRPELAQDRIVIANAKINLVGTKNALLPSISVFSDLRNNALAGNINTTVNPFTGLVPNHAADSFFIGGYGTVLGQLFARNFPNYSIGASLNIPLRNRAAQANMETALLTLRQNELTVQKEINQIRVDVQNALIAVQQARVRHQAAVKARILQEQTLDAEQKKYAMGTSTPYLVISAQRDLATAQETEVQAEASYIQAHVQLDLAMGTTLDSYNVEFADARRGQVARPPSPLPVLEKK